MAQKPNVLIFGGLNALGHQLAVYLVPPEGEPLVGHVRVVDKYSIFPPTTYVGKVFPKLVQDRKEFVEYRQVNLAVAANVTACFTDPAPNGQPYTHVMDLTGETAFDRPPEVQISQTLNVSLGIAKEAAKHGIKAYFRSLHPVYDHDTEKKQYKEEDADGWKPFGTRGVWWHETMRAVGSVPDLPLVVMRISQLYGPGMTHGEMTTTILLGLVYKHLDQQMQFLWSSKLKKNSVNTQDVVAAAWACCQWAATKTRAQLNEAAGVPLPPSGHASVESTPTAIKKDAGSVVVPVFNLTDDSDSDQGSIGEVLAQVYGIKTGYQGNLVSQFAKLKFTDVVEDINQLHMEAWTKMIVEAKPPVPNTPLSPYALSYQLEKHGCALDGTKIKQVVGYQLKYPQFTPATVKETVEWFRKEGIWPETGLY